MTPVEHDHITELVEGMTLDLEALRGGLEEAERVADRDRPPDLTGPPEITGSPELPVAPKNDGPQV